MDLSASTRLPNIFLILFEHTGEIVTFAPSCVRTYEALYGTTGNEGRSIIALEVIRASRSFIATEFQVQQYVVLWCNHRHGNNH